MKAFVCIVFGFLTLSAAAENKQTKKRHLWGAPLVGPVGATPLCSPVEDGCGGVHGYPYAPYHHHHLGAVPLAGAYHAVHNAGLHQGALATHAYGLNSAYGFGGLGAVHAYGPPIPLSSNAAVVGVQKEVVVKNQFAVPVPQPYSVPVEKPVPVPVAQPVPYQVDKPYPVAVPHPVPVPVERPVPYAVDKPYAVPQPYPVPYPVVQKVGVPVAQPYPVPHVHPCPVVHAPVPVNDPCIAPIGTDPLL